MKLDGVGDAVTGSNTSYNWFNNIVFLSDTLPCLQLTNADGNKFHNIRAFNTAGTARKSVELWLDGIAAVDGYVSGNQFHGLYAHNGTEQKGGAERNEFYNDDRTQGTATITQTHGAAIIMETLSNPYGITVTNASNTTPIIITIDGIHDLWKNNIVQVRGVTGNTGANGEYAIERVDATSFKLLGSVGNGAYAGGGTVIANRTSKWTLPIQMYIYVDGQAVPLTLQNGSADLASHILWYSDSGTAAGYVGYRNSANVTRPNTFEITTPLTVPINLAPGYATSLNLDSPDGEASFINNELYLGLHDTSDSWKFVNTAAGLLVQRYDVSSYVTKFTILDNGGIVLDMSGLGYYSDNAAAVAAGLGVGRVYRDNDDPDHLCVVH